MNPSDRRHFGSVRTIAVLAVAAVGAGLLAVGVLNVSSDTTTRTASAVDPCTPVVMVVRHGEDVDIVAQPYHALGPSGLHHASLYPSLFKQYLAAPHGVGPAGASVTICPIGKIIAIDPTWNNSANPSPSPNPYETIRPLAESLGLTIAVQDPQGVSYSTYYEWTTPRRLALLTGGTAATVSTVIAWDSAGLNPKPADVEASAPPKDLHHPSLLKALPVTFPLEPNGAFFAPQRTDFYVFAGQDTTTGQFATFKAYHQEFTLDGTNWYSKPALDLNEMPIGIRVGKSF
jgi:hypothetical protein